MKRERGTERNFQLNTLITLIWYYYGILCKWWITSMFDKASPMLRSRFIIMVFEECAPTTVWLCVTYSIFVCHFATSILIILTISKTFHRSVWLFSIRSCRRSIDRITKVEPMTVTHTQYARSAVSPVIFLQAIKWCHMSLPYSFRVANENYFEPSDTIAMAVCCDCCFWFDSCSCSYLGDGEHYSLYPLLLYCRSALL